MHLYHYFLCATQKNVCHLINIHDLTEVANEVATEKLHFMSSYTSGEVAFNHSQSLTYILGCHITFFRSIIRNYKCFYIVFFLAISYETFTLTEKKAFLCQISGRETYVFFLHDLKIYLGLILILYFQDASGYVVFYILRIYITF